jgi:hypothetical protein
VVRVFNNPAKTLQWTLLLSLNSKSSFCGLWHLLNSLLVESQESSVILASYELPVEFFLCALLALAQCPPGIALHKSLELLSSSELTTEFFSYALLALAQCPLGRALQNSKRVFVGNCVLLHSLAS